MIEELLDAVRKAGADESVRALLLGGRGPVFCAGADLNYMKRMAGYSRDENVADAEQLAALLHAIWACPKPTVARVHGDCYAGGLGLIAACDMAIVVSGAKFALTEVKIGLIPATVSPYVLRAMGERAASRYMLTGERFSAEEAYRIGLVQGCVAADALDREIETLLAHFADASPIAVEEAKRLIRDVCGREIDEALIEDTAELIADARASDDGKEGVRSFLEKRKPRWCG